MSKGFGWFGWSRCEADLLLSAGLFCPPGDTVPSCCVWPCVHLMFAVRLLLTNMLWDSVMKSLWRGRSSLLGCLSAANVCFPLKSGVWLWLLWLLATVHKCCLWLHSHNRTASCSKLERHVSRSAAVKSCTAELCSSSPSEQKSSSVTHNLPCPMHYPSPCSLSLSLGLTTGWVTGNGCAYTLKAEAGSRWSNNIWQECGSLEGHNVCRTDLCKSLFLQPAPDSVMCRAMWILCPPTNLFCLMLRISALELCCSANWSLGLWCFSGALWDFSSSSCLQKLKVTLRVMGSLGSQ